MTKEQIGLIKDYDEKMRHGYAVNGGLVTELYNKVLNKQVAPTNCGSCIRRRIAEMVNAMNAYLEEEDRKAEKAKGDKQKKVKDGE